MSGGEKFYILNRSLRGDGHSVFWKPGGCGYTSNLDEAGLYDEMPSTRPEDMVVPADIAQRCARRVVDLDWLRAEMGADWPSLEDIRAEIARPLRERIGRSSLDAVRAEVFRSPRESDFRLEDSGGVVGALSEALVLPGTGADMVFRNEGEDILYPTSIVVPGDVPPQLHVMGVHFEHGGDVLRSGGSVPAQLFVEPIVLESLLSGEVAPGQALVVSLRNCGSEELRFSRGRILHGRKRMLAAGRRLVGFGSTLVTPGTTARISVQPNESLHPPCRLYVPPQLLDWFEVVKISSGASVSQHGWLTRGDLLRKGYFNLAPDPVIPTNQFLTVEVRNLSDEARYFSAAILGWDHA